MTIAAGERNAPRTTNHTLSGHVPGALFVLYCYFIVDYFLHMPARIPGYGSIRPTLLLVLVISLFLFSQADKFRETVKDERLRAVYILIAYIIVSLPLVTWPGSVVRENLSEFFKAIVFLFFTAFIIDTDRRLRLFVLLFIALQIFRVLEPLYLNITTGYMGSQTHLGGGQFAGRLSGAPADVVNPNGLGFVIATSICFTHFILWRSPSFFNKIIYAALLPLLLYALILTMSRGGFVALLVVAFIIFKQSKQKTLLLLTAITLAVGAWNVMSDTQKDRYLSLVSDDTAQHGSVTGRFQGMLNEFSLGLERPLFGHGLGTTSEAKVHSGGGAQAAHNLYAQLLIEIGIIGFILFLRYLVLIYKLVKYNLSKLTELSGQDNRLDYHIRLNQALLGIFWMYAVFSFNYYGLSQYYWYLFGGLCIAFWRSLQRNSITSNPGLHNNAHKTLRSARIERT